MIGGQRPVFAEIEEYAASQDVSKLAGLVPKDVSNAASVKYDRKNPANSIVVAEQWSGLRGSRALL